MVWKLKAFLAEHRITPNALAERVKGKISKTSIYNLVQDEPPTGVHFVTLDVLISTLTDITAQKVPLESLLEYRAEPSLLWKVHAGMLTTKPEPEQSEDS